MKLKTFTIEDIRSWRPCYDPAIYLLEDWSGTALDILKMDKIPAVDRFRMVLRKDIIDKKTLGLFAVWCARQVQHLMEDPRSIYAIDIAEKFAQGKVSREELEAASNAARSAHDAAWEASGLGERLDYSGVWAARTAWDAAESAIAEDREDRSWTCHAARATAWAAVRTNWRISVEVAIEAQANHLIKMLKAGAR